MNYSEETKQVDETELLECLRKIGTGLIASGAAVGVIENTLTDISLKYGKTCEIVALPNFLIIKLGESSQAKLDLALQRLTSIQLNQISEFIALVDQVKNRDISLKEASRKFDLVRIMKPRFNAWMEVFGYFIACVGLTMLYRSDLKAMLITGFTSILVALMIIWFRRQSRFNILLPVFAAFVVSTLTFFLTREGIISGSTNLIITPLIIFLPGAILTTGMIELASMHILSGSSRLIYGAAVLLFLFVGIAAGFNVTELHSSQVYAFEAIVFPWWAPPLGTFLFGLGMFIRMSGSKRDLFWMLVVLYIAMFSQTVGERYLNPYFGAFVAATAMALSSEYIARSPHRTPALVSQVLAFWFLVPGARGLVSITSILSEDVQSAIFGLGEMVTLILAISLGTLLGTLIISPNKFIPLTADRTRS